ncbi:polysaccharide deacetylase family protein [Sphingomonas sp. NIBR02145]|uniref:polysaccharide deacetylase family protein n=1 Tax=Sphingomonas sp. NIBR02145 TaxID=3014784 RepID=UPI0022B3B2F0|nr:polysaccharide deacetylase family protein [Sphingomonas sp. NIBR02145]WHU02822.1 polysaccharide deacetylase family protein [Sphingomonas sp. NIBR02145]
MPKRAALKLAGLAGLSALARRATASQLRILCYHGLWLAPGAPHGNCLFMTPALFADRMARLARSGRPVLPLGEAVERLAADRLPAGAVVLTIDDGWASTHSHMLPVLEAHRLPATLYATTWYAERDLPVVNVAVDYLVAASGRTDQNCTATIRRIEALPEADRLDALRAFGRALGVGEAWLACRQFHLMGPDALADAHARGLDIQLHTHRHIDVAGRIGQLVPEIEANRAALRAATGGAAAEHFCYPSGTFHPSAPALLAASGVRSATLVSEGLNAPGANPYALRRFVDAQHVPMASFQAYLDGTLHYLSLARTLADRVETGIPRRVAAASGMLLCAL